MQNKTFDDVNNIYKHYNYVCFVCGRRANQLAHIISNSKSNRKKYNAKIIDSNFNVLPACSLACNALLDAGNNLQMKETVASIILNTALHPETQRAMIEQAVKMNVARKQDKIYGREP